MLSDKLNIYRLKIDRLYGKESDVFIEMCRNILFSFYASIPELLSLHVTEEDLDLISKSDSTDILFDMFDLGEGEIKVTRNNAVRIFKRKYKNLLKPRYKSFSDLGFDENIEFPKLVNHGGIMYGPPGNGKTYSWRKLKNVFPGVKFIEIDSSDIQAKGFGSSIKNIDRIYLKTKLNAVTNDNPFTLIFIDEINVLRQRSKLKQDEVFDGGASTTEHIMKHLGDSASNKFPTSYVIGATNLYHNVDDAVKRQGRLGYKYFYGNPSENQIKTTLSSIASELEKSSNIKISDEMINFISKYSAGIINFSGINGILNTFLNNDDMFFFLKKSKNVKKRIIKNTNENKNKVIKSLRNMSDDELMSLMNTKLLSNLDDDRTDEYVQKIIRISDFSKELSKNGKIIIEISGGRQIGKTTLAFKLYKKIIELYSKDHGFGGILYLSQYATFSSGSDYEMNSNSLYNVLIQDETDRDYIYLSDMIINIKIIYKKKITDRTPKVKINESYVKL